MSVIAGPLARLVRLVASWTGIDLDRGGRGDSLERFVATRVTALGAGTVEAYIASLTGPGHPEVVRLINTITVGHTWFFRDPDQLALITRLFESFPAGRTLSLWVAGCATGEDVYTLAMLADRHGRAVTILGTDINSETLRQAQAARYGEWATRDVPPDLRSLYLAPTADSRTEVAHALRQVASFQHHNLRDLPPLSPTGAWDLILCRNVLIYFSIETATQTVLQLARALGPAGWLLLGASELIHALPPEIDAVRHGERYALRRRARITASVPAIPSPPSLPAPAPEIIAITAPAPVDDALAHIERGNIRLDAGNLAGALGEYAKALELEPLSTEARLYTGIAYHMEDDHTAALQALRAALFLDPELWPASYFLALSYDKLGRPDEARREYRRVMDTSGLVPALKGRGGLLRNLDAWRQDVMMMARKRVGPERRAGGRTER